MKRTNAFTLVELAIVITIIGLLIGGVLKGQELLQNARLTSGGATIKASTAAVLTFRDIYKGLPGDIVSPSSYLPNCTAAPCSTAGDGDGMIGGASGNWSLETPRLWLHLVKAGLISGVDPNASFSGTTYFLPSILPDFAPGGKLTVWYYGPVFNSHIFYTVLPTADGSSYSPPPSVQLVMKYDLKYDDGLASTGDIRVYAPNCNSVTTYDPSDVRTCVMMQAAGF